MCRVIDQVGDYKILKASRSYIVKNVKGGYDNHGHFKQLKTCYLIIKLMQKRQVPRSKYLRQSAIRISIDINYVNKVKLQLTKGCEEMKCKNCVWGRKLGNKIVCLFPKCVKIPRKPL